MVWRGSFVQPSDREQLGGIGMHESLRVAVILAKLERCPCKRTDTIGISSMFSNMSALAVLLYAFVGCNAHFVFGCLRDFIPFAGPRIFEHVSLADLR